MKNNDIFLFGKEKQLGKKDKSNIGSWDKPIVKLCNKINKNKNYYTTSSCSGRIVLLKYSESKIKDAFIFRSHSKVTFSELLKVIESIDYVGLIEFQQTTCILHVACKNINDAFLLVKKAKDAGWKRSGVMNMGKERCMVELHSTESISLPIINNKKLIVSEEYLQLLVDISNKKLMRAWEKIKRLEKLV